MAGLAGIAMRGPGRGEMSAGMGLMRTGGRLRPRGQLRRRAVVDAGRGTRR